MFKAKIYKDVTNYKSRMGGLTLRQLSSLVAIFVVGISILNICQKYLYIFDLEKILYINLFFLTPILAYGFFEHEGNNFETIVKNVFKLILRMKFTYNED